MTAKILQEEQELRMAAPLLDGTGWWRRGFASVAYCEPVYRRWLAAEEAVRLWITIHALGDVWGGIVAL